LTVSIIFGQKGEEREKEGEGGRRREKREGCQRDKRSSPKKKKTIPFVFP
jgi:hypothetical protein